MNEIRLLGPAVRRGRLWQRALQITAASLAIAGTGAVSGCLTRPLQPEDTRTTSTVVTRLPESSVDKIDLLLMIDNSRSMADKQQILVQAVPDLVRGLVNPRCVDPDKPEDASKWSTPAGPLDPCPAGRKRDFKPVVDIHVGIVSSSLGGHGAESCPDEEPSSGGCPMGTVNRTNNDHGHLITRLSACTGAPASTYQDQGFLAWDPKQEAKDAQGKPAPGEKDIGDIAKTTNPDGTVNTLAPGLVPSLKDLVLGTGQVGCGFEASHESWYRFLIDPDPYETITVDPETGRANPQGVDAVLLQQRKDFLRPSSLLAIIGLTDENDCSIKEYGQFWLAGKLSNPNNTAYNLPKARAECAANPNDKCCVSTGQNAPEGCPPEPQVNHNVFTDPANLRCFDQKRRFGIDFLYPIDRYVTGLTQTMVPNRMGELVPNPIFSDLDPTDQDVAVRDASLVFLAYITGVPWQDIARRDATGKPDLLGGLDANMKPVGGFKSAAELSLPIDDQGHTGWDLIIGDPTAYVPPLDPHMIESPSPRSGKNPITGDQIAPTNSPAGADGINGHEYTPGTKDGMQIAADDLQYACIFKLPQPRDCSDPTIPACDCSDPKNDNPLCEPKDPNDPSSPRTKQVRAKGYPGIRELSLVKSLGKQGIVGSICPKQLDDQEAPDLGYRPAVGAIIDRLKVALGGQCLPRQLQPDEKTGLVQCLVLEALRTNGAHEKDCASFCDGLPARQHVTEEHKPAVEKAMDDPIATNAGWDCFCEIKQLGNGDVDEMGKDVDPSDDFLRACQNDASDSPVLDGKAVDGWCYVDATTTPPLGEPKIVAKCPATEKRQVRFVGAGNPQEGSTLFITCSGD